MRVKLGPSIGMAAKRRSNLLSVNAKGRIWGGVLAVIGLAAVLVFLSGGDNRSATSAQAIDRSSPEHRYITETFRRKGYSQAESEQAADSVIRFKQAHGKQGGRP
jgi:hypothetical protein